MATLSKKPLAVGKLLLTFAALNFAQLDELKDEIDLLMKPLGANFGSPEARKATVAVALASLKAAGSKVTEKELMANLDTVNFGDVITSIFSRNGFLHAPGEDVGEASAASSGS